jgi:hypothetical protein
MSNLQRPGPLLPNPWGSGTFADLESAVTPAELKPFLQD